MSDTGSIHSGRSATPSIPPSELMMEKMSTLQFSFPGIDPVDFLFNPAYLSGSLVEEYLKKPTGEINGVLLVNILKKYQELSQLSFEMMIASVKHKLQNNLLSTGEFYKLLTHTFESLTPPLQELPAELLKENFLTLFSKKQELHQQIANELKSLNQTITEQIEKIPKVKNTNNLPPVLTLNRRNTVIRHDGVSDDVMSDHSSSMDDEKYDDEDHVHFQTEVKHNPQEPKPKPKPKLKLKNKRGKN